MIHPRRDPVSRQNITSIVCTERCLSQLGELVQWYVLDDVCKYPPLNWSIKQLGMRLGLKSLTSKYASPMTTSSTQSQPPINAPSVCQDGNPRVKKSSLLKLLNRRIPRASAASTNFVTGISLNLDSRSGSSTFIPQ